MTARSSTIATPELWFAADHFDWLTTYLSTRGTQRSIALMLAGLVFALGGLELLMMLSPVGPRSPLARVAAAAVAASCAATATMWLRPRWPNRRQSTAFVALSTAGITAACLLESNPASAMVCTTLFALLGGYIGFFHSPRIMAINVAIGAATATFLASRIWQTDPALATVKLIVVVGVILAVPLMCQAVVQVLGDDVVDSDTDPLTGLLNRRGFYRRIDNLFARRRSPDRYLTMAMVDLDRFKLLNDTEGHAAGDQALIAVGRALQASSRVGTLIARIGGEEFLLADTSSAVNGAEFGERLRQAIQATPQRLSASVGTVTVRLTNPGPGATPPMVDALIRSADAAMYEAKRAGGNRSCNRSVDVGLTFGGPVIG